jgi:hypothetical protein
LKPGTLPAIIKTRALPAAADESSGSPSPCLPDSEGNLRPQNGKPLDSSANQETVPIAAAPSCAQDEEKSWSTLYYKTFIQNSTVPKEMARFFP